MVKVTTEALLTVTEENLRKSESKWQVRGLNLKIREFEVRMMTTRAQLLACDYHQTNKTFTT
jgi:hypothetical protein